MLESLYAALFGPADQGPVDFASLGRPGRPNTALIAPEGLVTGRKTDRIAPVFAHKAEVVRTALAGVIARETDVECVHADPDGIQDRYVQRSAAMRFPDTIDVRFIDLGDGRSTIALFSRSQLGYRDFGVNLARLDRWVGKLEKALA